MYGRDIIARKEANVLCRVFDDTKAIETVNPEAFWKFLKKRRISDNMLNDVISFKRGRELLFYLIAYSLIHLMLIRLRIKVV